MQTVIPKTGYVDAHKERRKLVLRYLDGLGPSGQSNEYFAGTSG